MNWFYGFAARLSRWMAGRNGIDPLGMATLVLYFILTAAANFTGLSVLYYLSLVFFIVGVWRMLSRNVFQRRKENDVFLRFWSRIVSAFRGFSGWQRSYCARIRDRQTHRYFKCPNCKNKLRVPRGRGKIVITCPVCHTEFTKKA